MTIDRINDSTVRRARWARILTKRQDAAWRVLIARAHRLSDIGVSFKVKS